MKPSHRVRVLLLAALAVLLVAPTRFVPPRGITITGGIPDGGTLTECIGLNAGGGIQTAAGTATLVVEEGTHFAYQVYNLDDTDDEEIHWTYPLPANIAGTTATVRVDWLTLACTADSADDVCWVWNGGGFLDDEAYDGGELSGTETFIQDKCTTVGNVHTQTTATTWTHGYDVTSPKDTNAVFQIIREQTSDATCTGDDDDISGDVQLLNVLICYEVTNVASGEDG